MRVLAAGTHYCTVCGVIDTRCKCPGGCCGSEGKQVDLQRARDLEHEARSIRRRRTKE